ncbi:MAG: hypothetical protein FWE88_01660 [Phycisphaerae bacterium]|nr:hypothetical protein [Phycisphaerae bacterium]
MKITTLCLAAAVLAAMFLGGCAKFTRQNYEMVQIGDDRGHVEHVLGKPEYRHSSVWTYVHRSPYYQAKIHFEDNQVSRKEWFDAKTTWNPPAE